MICYRIHFTFSGVLEWCYFLRWEENNDVLSWRTLTALENENLIPIVKYRKFSVMVWGSIASKGVGVIRILDKIMTKEEYLDIKKNELITSIKKFGFINPVNPNKFYYKCNQDNDSKQKSYLCKSCLLHNCT